MITRGIAPRLRSITIRVVSVDSSRRSEIPSIALSLISSAIRITNEARFTLYGIADIIISSLPFASTTSAIPRVRTIPLPVFK